MTQWQIGFLLADLQDEYTLLSPTVRVFRLNDSDVGFFRQLLEKSESLKPFAHYAKDNRLYFALLRVTAGSLGAAATSAFNYLQHYLDCLSLVVEREPRVASQVLVREGTSKDVIVRQYLPHSWVFTQAKDVNIATEWRGRCLSILRITSPLLEKAFLSDWASYTELEKQMFHSLRLFHIGRMSESYSVEYLCKFAALESLVLGGQDTQRKGETLKQRIGALCPNVAWNAARTIGRLWKKRHSIVHEARAESFGDNMASQPYQIEMDHLDYLFIRTVIFAAENCQRVKSVRELWNCTSKYVSPECSRIERPHELARYAAVSIVLDEGLYWPNGGSSFDLMWDLPPKVEHKQA